MDAFTPAKPTTLGDDFNAQNGIDPVNERTSKLRIP